MKRRKLHHIVPKVLQRAFCHSPEHIWYCERNPAGKLSPPEDRNIISAFRKRNYYTVLDENDAPSDEIEESHYGPLDSYLGKILPRIYADLEKRSPPSLSPPEIENLRIAVWEMTKRTPDFIKQHDDFELGHKAIQEILQKDLYDSDSDRHRELLQKLGSNTRIIEYGRDIRVRATIQHSERVKEALANYVPRWVTINGKHSFVLSSLMIYRIGNGGANGLINPDSEIWFPISPKFALVLLRDPNNRIPILLDETRDHARAVNEFAVRNSTAVGSHSKELLDSLIRSC